jgi:hypothetical protein
VFRRAAINAATVLVIVLFGAGAGVLGWRMGRPAAKAPAPPPATTFLHAVKSMQAASGYKFAGRVTIGIEVLNVTGSFSAPDHLDQTLQLVGGPPLERVSIGAVTYQRGPFGWRSLATSPAVGDPRVVFTALGAASGVTQLGSTFAFSLSGASAATVAAGATAQTVVTGSATIQGGWVQALSYRSTAGAGTTVSFTYTAMGSTPPVTAPPAPAS